MPGKYVGFNYIINIIPMRPTELPFEVERFQSPERLSFTMKINNTQGQSLKITGLNLEDPAFSHGRVYVGLSRVENHGCVFILVSKEKTKYIVYHETLD